ncbi:MAG: hypothetical protein AB8B96_09385 [Lysobacterales bacterium]
MTVMNVLSGCLFGLLLVAFWRARRVEHWAYAWCLMVLPGIYVGFALFADESGIVAQELMFGLPFLVVGPLCAVFSFPRSAVVLGLMWIAHGFYDAFHHLLFINSGVLSWYPGFCAGVDVLIGSYLLVLSTVWKNAKANPAHSKP